MHISRIPTALATVILFGTEPCSAAVAKCEIGDTIEQCWQRYMPAQTVNTVNSGANEVDANAAATSVENRLKSFETGLDGGTAELATTTRNLLPLLAVSGLVSDSDDNVNDQLFTFDLNFLIPGLAKDHNAQLQAVLNTDPQMDEPLRTAFDTATGNADRSAELQKTLSAADDYTVSFTYSHINKNVGRSFKQYQRQFSNLFEAAITSGTGPGVDESRALAAMTTLLQKLDIDSGELVLKDERTLEAVEAAARSESNLEQRVREAMVRNRLPRFAELVNNQPQLTLSAQVRERDDLVGANERAIKVAYEFGLANVNRFEATYGDDCNLLNANVNNLSLDLATRCLDRFRKYIDDNEQRLKNADRFVMELSYVDVSEYNFTSVPDGVSVARDGTDRLDFSVGYGRTMQVAGDNHESRLDFVAKYEDYSDDPDHQDRLVATLTLTTRLNGISIPIALVYANRGKFLPETDEQLSVHIGFKYQLDSKQD